MGDPLASLVVASLRHGEASLDEREHVLARLTDQATNDGFLFATCHRVELYRVLREPIEDAAIAHDLGAAHLRIRRGTEAGRHLFRVAAGLDSVITGETQVLGQLRRARQSARGVPILDALVQRALHVARVVRSTTGLGASTRSLGSLAVDEALRHVARPETSTALVVGAGEVGALAARALRQRVAALVVANRGESRALEVARYVGAEAVPLTQIDQALTSADIVISAADTRGAILNHSRLERRLMGGPLVLVDLAMPRSVAADARELRGLVYRTVDDLRNGAAPPADIVSAAERICAEAAARFAEEWRERAAAPVIHALRVRADAVRRRQLARALSRLRHLGARDREVVNALAWSLTNALLHEPTLALRDDPERADAARELFGLEEPSR